MCSAWSTTRVLLVPLATLRGTLDAGGGGGGWRCQAAGLRTAGLSQMSG